MPCHYTLIDDSSWRTPSYYNKATQQLFDEFENFSLLNQTGTAAMIDFFPLLRHLPDWVLPTQKRAKEHHAKEKALYLKLWLDCKAQIVAGQAKPCFCVNMAKVQEAEKFSDDLAAYISGTLLEAGSDTTSNTLYGFIKAMVLFPDVQKKAQAQLDEVVGPNRLPELSDEPQLVCLIAQLLRNSQH
jgi:cytochrome P450